MDLLTQRQMFLEYVAKEMGYNINNVNDSDDILELDERIVTTKDTVQDFIESGISTKSRTFLNALGVRSSEVPKEYTELYGHQLNRAQTRRTLKIWDAGEARLVLVF